MERGWMRINFNGVGSTGVCLPIMLIVCLFVCCFVQLVRADVVATGDVDPDDPATWALTTYAYIGRSGNGTLDIIDGGEISNHFAYIGYESGSTGAVTVEGIGSIWTNKHLSIALNGSGTLDITSGGMVSSGSGSVGSNGGSTGVVKVDGDGSTWTNSGNLNVASNGMGTLVITNGGVISNNDCFIGSHSGTGMVTVDGVGSIWTSSGKLEIGRYGNGTLDITGGGTVVVGGETRMARYAGSSGMINFDNGTLTTGGLNCSINDLSGTGTINTNGLVSDIDLVFDSAHGLNQTFSINKNIGQNITVNLDVDGAGSMGVGYSGTGTMSISDGIDVVSKYGCIGYSSGSTGVVTVDGADSTWSNSGYLDVGYKGSGTLNITSGGMVSSESGYLGEWSGSTGAVTVDGVGSVWTNSGNLNVGDYGSGTLAITDGGAVSSFGASIGYFSGSSSVVTVDGFGSSWTNSGRLKIGNWSGSGTLNITGGGIVSNDNCSIGNFNISATGVVAVDGVGSTWTNGGYLYVGRWGRGSLDITGGGLVSVADVLTIDYDGGGDSFVNMASGGMLALMGDADGSLDEFLGLVEGAGAIRYWDASVLDWADITGATLGVDYSLGYIDYGDLDGYTMLTVNTIPEPCSLVLLGLGGLVLHRRRG